MRTRSLRALTDLVPGVGASKPDRVRITELDAGAVRGPRPRARLATRSPMMRRAALIALVSAALAACAGLGQREPIRVNLAGLESIPGAGMEARFLAKVRIQNPNDASITYNGISAEVDLNGRSFASGVSDASGEIPRFSERVIEVPLTVPATAIARQVLGLFTGDHSKANYRVRGFLNTDTFWRPRFDSTGEIELPKLTSSGN